MTEMPPAPSDPQPHARFHIIVDPPRFTIGDALRLDGVLFVVSDVLQRGRWAWQAGSPPTVDRLYFVYRLVVQDGSSPTMLVRPGMVLDLDGLMVEAEATVAEKPVVTVPPDSAENIQQRHAEWLAGYDGYPPSHPRRS